MKIIRLLFFDPFHMQYRFYVYIKERIFKPGYILCILSILSLTGFKKDSGNKKEGFDHTATLMDKTIEAYEQTPEMESHLGKIYDGKSLSSFYMMLNVVINTKKAKNTYKKPMDAIVEWNSIAHEINASMEYQFAAFSSSQLIKEKDTTLHNAIGNLLGILVAETEEYIPDEYVPEEYISDEYVPEEYIPDEYVPEEYISDEYIPEQESNPYAKNTFLLPNSSSFRALLWI